MTTIKKGDAAPSIPLERNPDILTEASTSSARPKVVVGFAAETHNLEAYAKKKLHEKRLDLLVANDVTQEGAGFGCQTNIATIFDATGHAQTLPCMTKEALANRILDRVLEQLLQKR